MSHQLSHTFPICAAKAQTPVKLPSTVSQTHPAPLLSHASRSQFLVDGWLKEERSVI